MGAVAQPQSTSKGVGFQSIRRITGYITGNVKYLNNAKQIESSEQAPHTSVGTLSITPTA